MIYLRNANERGRVDLGWLQSQHSFSFGHYYDTKHMGFSALRVINDDVVQAGRGFETHGHRDMEIISYVVSGALKHQDSEGNQYVVPKGDVQVMSAGKGIMHSEFNPSSDAPVNFLQIWIVPNVKGGEPSYAQKTVGVAPQGEKANTSLELLVSPNGTFNSLHIKQDASISQLRLGEGERHAFSTQKRKGYLHIISGTASIQVESEKMLIERSEGDAVGIFEHDHVEITASTTLIALWFDLPAL